jgi:DNA-binding transcriptional LysR family regulator
VMRSWARQRLGVALLPEFSVLTDLADGELIRLDLPLPDLSLRLVWRTDRAELPGLREVLYAAAQA